MYSYQALRRRRASRYSPYGYGKRKYGRTYTRKYSTRRPRKIYNTRKVKTVRRTYKKRMVGPQPVRLGHTMAALRTAIKMNEDFMLMYTDSSQQTASVENLTAIGSYMLAHSTDISQMFAMLPPINSNATSRQGNNSLIMKTAEHLVTFSNFAQEIADVFVWVVRCKRDAPVQGANTQFFNPAGCWQQGVEGILYGNVPVAPSTSGGYLHPHSQPYDSSIFNQYWYTVKRMRFQLLPGGTKDIKYSLGNMPYKSPLAADGDTSYVGAVCGITMAILWQIRGAPCVNAPGGNAIYYSRPSVGVVENKRYHFTYTGDMTKQINYSVNTPGGNALANPAYINPLSGYASNSGPNVTVINTNASPVPVIGTGTTAAGTFLNTKTVTS